MTLRRALAVLLPFAAAPAAAQDAEAALGLARACLDLAEDRAAEAACLGTYSRACMAESPEGDTTVGITRCVAAETEAWDRLLNEAYAELVLLARRRALLAEEASRTPAPHEDLMREAQRAWIAFRDADCEQEYAVWGEGSLRQVAGAYCTLERTAQRTFELRAKRAAMEID